MDDSTGGKISVIGKGIIYGHVFENPEAGLDRTLFWSLSIEFKPSSKKRTDASVRSVTCEWLTLELRDWIKLDGLSAADIEHPTLVECSYYQQGEHFPGRLESLSIRADSKPGQFRVLLSIGAPPRHDGGLPAQVSAECIALFDGFVVVPGNLTPPPGTPEEAARILSEFVDMHCVDPPVWDRFRFVFKPAASQSPS